MPIKSSLKIVLTVIGLLVLSSCGDAAPADAGKLRIKADKAGAYIYIDGDKKGMIGDSGYTNILLAEGEYKIKVEKASNDGEWVYTKTRTVFLGADSSVKLNFKLDDIATKKRKTRLAREAKEKKVRLAREAKEKKARLAREAKEKKARLARERKQKIAKLPKIFIKHNQRYIGNNDTVVDKTTGLMWKKCSEGQNGNNCTGTAKEYKWQAALDHAKTVNFAGHSDWRLPTIKELHSLVFCSNGKVRKFKDNDRDSDSCRSKAKGNYESPTINQISFPNTPADNFWSSSPHSNGSYYAWIVGFVDGYDGGSDRDYSGRLRLVRSGQ